ncbi:hypothetical protein ECG_08872 [Echinococcus granulosus]|uniref:Uncharacterized protein n=2 Tax=Echinococcus granulosus TaxID=6210 RepID=A0A068WUA3_ECHGR|nr:hypothetical protein ECG_08872 [Echinococcus granulosus]CDS23740.1 hypothetical protein EgrG_002044700 [Echinococcus granulosus]
MKNCKLGGLASSKAGDKRTGKNEEEKEEAKAVKEVEVEDEEEKYTKRKITPAPLPSSPPLFSPLLSFPTHPKPIQPDEHLDAFTTSYTSPSPPFPCFNRSPPTRSVPTPAHGHSITLHCPPFDGEWFEGCLEGAVDAIQSVQVLQIHRVE